MIRTVRAEGKTSYLAAFNLTFEMIDNSIKKNVLWNPKKCDKTKHLFLFITDGIPSKKEETEEVILDFLDENDEYNISLFSYALTNPNEQSNQTKKINTILTKMSCNHNGIMFDIEKEKKLGKRDLVEIIGEYNHYLSIQVRQNHSIWTEPYEDSLGFGQMVTIVHPVYYQ